MRYRGRSGGVLPVGKESWAIIRERTPQEKEERERTVGQHRERADTGALTKRRQNRGGWMGSSEAGEDVVYVEELVVSQNEILEYEGGHAIHV